ncbi:sensor histidine kinase [uncultured Helicobacter sp.]|uniref:sensor histidine kinase n=1 Tax=uncultured Helicobacter sp. TaxID=175537 RepID=UPI00374F65E9
MFKSIQNKLQRSTIQGKTHILLYLIVIIFLLCWATGFLALAGLKADYDSNYPTQKISMLHISEIQNLFGDLDTQDTKIKILWQAYKNDLEQKENRYKLLHKIRQWYQSTFLGEQKKQVTRLLETQRWLIREIDTALEGHSKAHNELFTQLVQTNIKLATINKEVSDSLYGFSLKILGFFLFMLACMFLILSKAITDSINSAYNSLENLVTQKTIQLQTLNDNLQKSIEHEVKQNQQKDLFLYQQARLASMGEMIHNIAHQWRQPLNSLTLLIQSFKTKYDQGKFDKEFLYTQTEYGLKIAKNMSETIEGFSTFFRPDREKTYFSIKKALSDSLELLSSVLYDESIQVSIKAQEDLEILGYENAFTQVVFVLLNNAIDAFKESKHDKNTRFVEISINPKDENLTISVKDNAGGIKLDDIQKIFEPYFTTKHKSVGTGIGLYMARQIIEKQFFGSIEVQNIIFKQDKNTDTSSSDVESTGTAFSIIIPYGAKILKATDTTSRVIARNLTKEE